MKGNIKIAEEQQAQGQTQFLADLIEHIAQPMIIASADKHLYLWNKAFSKLTGYTNKELRDPIISAGLTAPEWHEGETKALEKLRRTGQTQTFQKEYIRKDGSRVPVEVLVYQVTSDVGKVKYYVGLITDITDRKQLEEALAKSEKHYRTLVENAIEGIVVTQDKEIKFVNPIVSVATGYSAEELQSMSLKDLVHPDDEKAVIESLSKASVPGTLRTMPPFRIHTKGGESRWIEAAIVSIIWDDKAANLNLLRDITERKRLEEHMGQESRLIIDSAPIIIFYKDEKGRFVRVNKAFAEALQMSEQEFLGKTVFDLYSTEIAQSMTDDDQEVLKSGQPKLNIIEQYESASGTRWVRTDKIPIFDKAGNPAGLVGFAQDITEQKGVEDTLRQSEERYRTILEDMKEGYWEVDIAGNYTSFNDAVCRLLGYSKKELTGMNYRTNTKAEDIEKVYRAFNKVYRTGESITNMHYEVIRKDGSNRFAETSVFPMRNEKGDIIGFRGVSHDVTDRLQIEEALKKSEEKYRTILEEMEEAYYEDDLAGNFTFVNDALCQQLGYSREELVGMNYRAYTPPEDIERVFKAYNEVYRTGKPIALFHNREVRKDGSRIVAEISIIPIRDEKGEIIGFRGVGRDITKRLQTEEALRQSEEKYRTILQGMEESYYEVDQAGNFTFFNDAICRQLGYSREELMGMNYKAYTPPEKVKEVFQTYNLVFRTGEPSKMFDMEQIRKDGTRITIQNSIFPLRNEKGEITGFRGVGRDITERKQMLEALRQSEERYRTILEETKEAYYEMDLRGNFTFFNDALCQHLGYSREELTGMNYKVYVPPEKTKDAFEQYNHVYRTGETTELIDIVQIKKDKTRISIECSVSPIRNESNEITGFRGIMRDITKRKESEEALRRSEERYRTVMDEMDEGYYETDLEGNYTFFNDVICKKFGYSREELTGMNYTIHTKPEDVKTISDAYTEVYRTGKPLKWIAPPQIRKDGTIVLAEDSVSALRNEEGEIIGFRGISRDITERKRIEEALRKSEERYRTILEDMRESYFEVDLAGNYTFFNDALCRHLGYSREELMGLNYRSYVPAEKVKETFEIYNRIYRTGEPAEMFDIVQVRKDGSQVIVECSASAMRNDKGEIIGFRGVLRDVSERKRAEEERRQLEQKAQLASRLASVGELASGVAHEINNPLTGVIGYAHLLLAREDIPKDIVRDVEIINEGAQRVSNIVKKLLAFARQTKPEQRYVNVNELIRNTLDLQAYALAANNIKVNLQLERDLPMTIADPGQLQQVFLNLIMNAEEAIKSARDKGKLVIKTEHTDNTIRISFKDNGLGIPEEDLAHIFDPFFTTREVGQGTGLGLSVCHGIVTEHKGRIWAENEPGKGAIFIVELPTVIEDKQPEIPEPVIIEEPKKVAKAKILVVDDEPVIRQLVSQVLTDEGHMVETADNAADALELVKSKRYRLILLDIKMPGMSGVELYKQFQKIAPSLTKRVVFITGDVMGKRTMSFLDKTKAQCLMKPFDAKQLKAEMKRILARR
ncbi:MAG: PAS domain S-box protein [Chloroflexota bacterium]|nr:MAG: PAS domain S-box protein [Chloroflexota bacterium]